jgi:hypothetical protein
LDDELEVDSDRTCQTYKLRAGPLVVGLTYKEERPVLDLDRGRDDRLQHVSLRI